MSDEAQTPESTPAEQPAVKPPPTPKRRWYDQDELIAYFVHTMEAFPNEVQKIIAEGITQLADDQFQANEILESRRTIGREKVLALFKSKQYQRKYDGQPLFHKAMNYFFILNERNRKTIVQKSNEVLNFSVDYFQMCETYEQDPDLKQVSTITHSCLREGGEKAQLFLRGVKEAFQRSKPRSKTTIQDDKIVS